MIPPLVPAAGVFLCFLLARQASGQMVSPATPFPHPSAVSTAGERVCLHCPGPQWTFFNFAEFSLSGLSASSGPHLALPSPPWPLAPRHHPSPGCPGFHDRFYAGGLTSVPLAQASLLDSRPRAHFPQDSPIRAFHSPPRTPRVRPTQHAILPQTAPPRVSKLFSSAYIGLDAESSKLGAHPAGSLPLPHCSPS